MNLTAVEDENGVLTTNLKLFEDIVLAELEKIIQGHQSQFFSFKGDKIVRT